MRSFYHLCRTDDVAALDHRNELGNVDVYRARQRAGCIEAVETALGFCCGLLVC